MVELLVLSYFPFQPALHYWCNKGRGMCYPVCGMVHIKEPLLPIGKSSPCGSNRFPLSLSEWSFTICLMPYNRKKNVLSASLNKTFPSTCLYYLYLSQCEHCQCILTVRHILVECNHFAQKMKDIFGKRNVVETFWFHPTHILLCLKVCQF